MSYDIDNIRDEFPILQRKVGDRQLVYLDNTATSQTPHRVVEEVVAGYEHTKANVHRGVHIKATEKAADRILNFIFQ